MWKSGNTEHFVKSSSSQSNNIFRSANVRAEYCLTNDHSAESITDHISTLIIDIHPSVSTLNMQQRPVLKLPACKLSNIPHRSQLCDGTQLFDFTTQLICI